MLVRPIMYTRSCFRLLVWTQAIIVFISFSLSSGHASPFLEEELPLSATDTKLGVVNQLRNISERLRHLRLTLLSNVPYRNDELIRLLQNASGARQSGQSLELSFLISKILNRPKISKLIIYPQLLETLGKSLIDIGLAQAGYERVKEYLMVNKSTPLQYESMFFAYLDTAQRLSKNETFIYQLDEVKKYWERYRTICRNFNRTPSTSARYMFAKHLYLLKGYDEASTQLKLVTRSKGFTLRALYILGVISIERGSFEEAKGHFRVLEKLFQKEKKTYQSTNIEVISSTGKLKVSVLTEVSSKKSEQRPPKEERADYQGLSPDLRALYEDFIQEESVDKLSNSLGKGPPLEANQVLETMASLMHMTLARLALLEGNYVEAWQRYREVPKGLEIRPNLYLESQLEYAYTLRMKEEYAWSARILEQLIEEYPSGRVKLGLKLQRAEMLIKNDQQNRGTDPSIKDLYATLERELKTVLVQLKSASDSTVLFPPEVGAWLPPQLYNQGKKFATLLREQELWLNQAERDLLALKEVAKQGRYPALVEATNTIDAFKDQLNRRLKQLPQLIQRWGKQKSPLLNNQRRFKEVQRGVQYSQYNELKRFSINDIQNSAQQLLARLKGARKELANQIKFYQKHLNRLIKAEQKMLNSAKKRFTRLKNKIVMLSKQAQSIALTQVENDLSQLILEPILSDYWYKERVSELLDAKVTLRRIELGYIRDLDSQEESAPKLGPLNLLDPVIESFIVNPLPDPEKELSKRSSRRRFKRRF